MVESAVKQAYEVAKKDAPQLALTQMPYSKNYKTLKSR